jgi:DNA-binding cell septation regulator SpoVG
MAKILAEIMLNEQETGPLARGSISYGGVVKVNGYTVWPKKDGSGYAVMHPQRSNTKPDDKFTNSVYGNNTEIRDEINKAVLDAYEEALTADVDFDVSVFTYKNPRGKSLGVADVTLNGEFVMKDFSIFEGNDGEIAVSAPKNYWQDAEGNWQHAKSSYIHSIKRGLMPAVVDNIRAAYEKAVEEGKFESSGAENDFTGDQDQQMDSEPVGYVPADQSFDGEEHDASASIDREGEDAER